MRHFGGRSLAGRIRRCIRGKRLRRTPRFSARELNSRVFAKAAMTKYHRLGSLSKRNLFSHSSGGHKSKIQVSTALVFPEASLLGLHLAAFLCPHMVLSLCVCIPSVLFIVPFYVQFPFLIRIPVRLD